MFVLFEGINDLLNHPLVQVLVALFVVGFTIIILFIKFYNYYTCGYYRKMHNMKGKTVIITGPTGGIGKETAREMASRGAKLILACRNVDKGNQVKRELIEITKNDQIIVKHLDLSSQNSVRKFAQDIIGTENYLHVLIHNAGTAEKKIQITEDDLELTMATNHFGPFLLTHLLIDLLKKSSPSRIVVVASELYRICNLNLDNLNPRSSWFPPFIYYPSKYANILFTKELARRLENSGVTANCLHPGLIDTGIWNSAPTLLKWPMMLIIKGFFKTPVEGCQTSVYLSCSDEVADFNGKYFMDCKEHGLNNGAQDMDKAKKFWELSKEFVKLRTNDPQI